MSDNISISISIAIPDNNEECCLILTVGREEAFIPLDEAISMVDALMLCIARATQINQQQKRGKGTIQ